MPRPTIADAHRRLLRTLERAGRPWRIVCASGSLSGLRAAALAGLGVTVHAHGLMPEGLQEVAAAYRLPDLGDVEFVAAGGHTEGAWAGGGTGFSHERRRTPRRASAQAFLSHWPSPPLDTPRTRH